MLFLIAFCEQQALCRGQATQSMATTFIKQLQMRSACHGPLETEGHCHLEQKVTVQVAPVKYALCMLHISTMYSVLLISTMHCACCTHRPCTGVSQQCAAWPWYLLWHERDVSCKQEVERQAAYFRSTASATPLRVAWPLG